MSTQHSEQNLPAQHCSGFIIQGKPQETFNQKEQFFPEVTALGEQNCVSQLPEKASCSPQDICTPCRCLLRHHVDATKLLEVVKLNKFIEKETKYNSSKISTKGKGPQEPRDIPRKVSTPISSSHEGSTPSVQNCLNPAGTGT